MQVVKNFLYNVSYQLLVIILPLITVPYVSNILGAEGIGNYAFTYANMQYFVIFGMVGITLYGNRQIAYVRENKENLKNTFYSIYTLQLITTTISFVLYLIFTSLFLKSFFNKSITSSALSLFVYTFSSYSTLYSKPLLEK